MEYKLKWPDVKGRKEIKASDVKYGDVVAVAEFCRNSFTNEIEFGRTGLAVMESPDWAIWYINLCKEEGREWVNIYKVYILVKLLRIFTSRAGAAALLAAATRCAAAATATRSSRCGATSITLVVAITRWGCRGVVPCISSKR